MKVKSAVINKSYFTGLQRAGAVALLVLATTLSAHAQLTNNPYVVNTTNTVVLTPIGTNGFGVALIGYPMFTPGTNFFSDNLDGVALSDASTAPETGFIQFFAADEDNFIGGSLHSYNVIGRRVLQSMSNPNNMTVYQSFVASIQTNSPVGPDSGFGSGGAGAFGMGGVSMDGTIVVRMDGNSSPAGTAMAGEAVVTFPSYVTTTIIATDACEPLANGGRILVIDSTGGNCPQIGQSSDLVSKNSFNGYSYVCRPDINPANVGTLNSMQFTTASPPNPVNGTNGQTVVGSAGINGNITLSSWATRGSMGMNDKAKTLTTYVKTAADLAAGGDAETGLAVIKYTDAGGPITGISLQTNIFGKSATGVFPSGGISTNAQYFFSRVAFNGPVQQSINDSGAVAFAVSINIDQANDATNGTRFAQVTGILYMPPNGGISNFLKVCDNTDPTLFWQAPSACASNKNLISDVAIDNYNNVYFEAAYAGNPVFSTNASCDFFPSNAVYEAVANDPLNPTSWSVRILMKQDDIFTNQVSGDVFQLIQLNYEGSASIRTVGQRSFGPNAINRTQLPGHTLANTTPSSPYAVGGILVQATLTNLTQSLRTDGLLYIAPYTSSGGCTSLPFVVTSIKRTGNDINLVYNAQTGTNVVQASPGIGVSGNYTNGTYTDLSTFINTGCPVSTNYVDIGGGTNTPTRYYRVNLRE